MNYEIQNKFQDSNWEKMICEKVIFRVERHKKIQRNVAYSFAISFIATFSIWLSVNSYHPPEENDYVVQELYSNIIFSSDKILFDLE